MALAKAFLAVKKGAGGSEPLDNIAKRFAAKLAATNDLTADILAAEIGAKGRDATEASWHMLDRLGPPLTPEQLRQRKRKAFFAAAGDGTDDEETKDG